MGPTDSAPPPIPSGRWAAVFRGECPRCRRAPIFSGTVTMNEKCPSCGLLFNREPGYFSGAMYISYAMAVPIAAVVAIASGAIFPAWPFEATIAAAFGVLVPLAPLLFRYSRILWIHFDRSVDP